MRIRRDVLALTTPVFFEQLFVNLLGTVNAIMAARIGSDAVAAIGMVDSINLIVSSLFSALAIGASVVVAQLVGSGQRERAGAAAAQALAACGLLALLLAVLCAWFREPLLAWLYGNPGTTVQGYMHEYLLITALTYPLTALTLVISGALRGAGETRLAMQANTLMNVLNVLFGYVLIYGVNLQTAWFSLVLPGYGVAGAAVAISLARLAGAVWLLAMLRRYSTVLPMRMARFRFQASLLRAVFSIGVPASVESLVFNGGKLLVQMMVVGMGTAAIAANYIGFSVSMLLNVPGNALAVALTTLVGQAVGRGDEEAAARDMWYVLKLSTIAMLGIAIVCAPLAKWIVGLYSTDPEVISLGASLVLLNCLFLVVFPSTFVLPNGLRGAGDARYAMFTTLIGLCVFRLCLGYAFGVLLGWGVIGIWLGMFYGLAGAQRAVPQAAARRPLEGARSGKLALQTVGDFPYGPPSSGAYGRYLMEMQSVAPQTRTNGAYSVERQWFLESIAADGSRVTYTVTHLPFRIGRDPENDLAIATLGLSRHHALFTPDISGRIRLTDLNSTNGSFVNRRRVEGSRLLEENDIVHFGTAEFRLRLRQHDQTQLMSAGEMHTMLVPNGMNLSELFVPNEAEFMALLEGHGLSGAAQPIVDAHSRAIFAYELLGRANHPLLPASPIRLFELASALDREVELSVAFRQFGIAAIAPHLKGFPLFANTHPKETFSEAFFTSLVRLRQHMPELDLVVEIHETAVTESKRLIELAARFRDIGVRFAYDDFGAGQARLNELGEAPAHFVKFDMGLVHDIHLASERKHRVVRDLVKLVLDLGSVPLAEGIEMEAEAAICCDMGFQLIQGFLTGKPIPADQL
jgi:putative MATE family efflux protein